MELLTVADLARAYPWPEAERWVRAMMLHSLDGAVAGPDGRSGSLSSPMDRQVLADVRRLADAVIVGAQTIRVERYGPMRAKAEHAHERAALGLAIAPVLVIVSGRLDLDWSEPVFSESAITPIVITSAASDLQQREIAQAHADLVVLDGEHVMPEPLFAELARRGLRRIVCEGGPTLLNQFIAAGVVDELDFTIAPWIVGREQPVPSLFPESRLEFEPVSMMTDDGYAFMRYLRSRAK